MKKILFALLILTTFASKAQVLTFTPGGDTIRGGSTINIMTAVIPGSWGSVTVQPVFLKFSGTPAGTAFLQGSLNGQDYNTIGADSIHIGNVSTTQSTFWTFSTTQFPYYRIKTTSGAGTMKVVERCYIMYKDKKPN